MSLTAGRHWPAQGVKLTGLTKKSVFRAENGIFFKSSFYTKMICDPKYNFSLGQKYLVVASFKVCIFHQIQPIQNTHIRSHKKFRAKKTIFRGAFGLFSQKYPKGGPLENFEKKYFF